MITEYNKYINRSCVSFDFDGVLHLSTVGDTIHPKNYTEWKTWIPSTKIHRILRSEHKAGNKIVVISARCPWACDGKDEVVLDTYEILNDFFKKYHLPVDDIILTCDHPKIEHLIRLKCIRHYDDNYKMEYELEDTNIEFVYVYKDNIVKRIKNG